MNSIARIEQNEVYKQILRESFGGIMYNVANRKKYDGTEILKIWNSMSPAERGSANGIMTGAICFLTED